MGFPIFQSDRILFTNNGPAFSTNCCCDIPPEIPSRCCGSVIELEYEVYDETNTFIVHSGSYTWNLESNWTATPPEDEVIEVVEFFQVTNGDYMLEQASTPNAYCFSPNFQPVTVRVIVSLAAYKNGSLYANPAVVLNYSCPLDGVFSPWILTGVHRMRIRYT